MAAKDTGAGCQAVTRQGTVPGNSHCASPANVVQGHPACELTLLMLTPLPVMTYEHATPEAMSVGHSKRRTVHVCRQCALDVKL